MPEYGIENWLTHAHDKNASIQSASPSNSRRISSNEMSNSSSVIKDKYAPSDINTLGWQLHVGGVSMQEIENWKRKYTDWDVKAVLSSHSGKFDMYVKRR